MMTYRCLIADDEPIARQIIETYCSHLPYLQVLASCGNALEAKQILQQEEVDILFLDINMPVIDGLSFLRSLKKTPAVILTTAYREYAVEAFELSVSDYLVKPFSMERFMKAVDKAIEKIQSSVPVSPVSSLATTLAENSDTAYLFLKTDRKIYRVNHNDLLYAEASGNFTRFVTTTETLSVGMTFTNTEELLPRHLFVRVHRSFIINKSKISLIEGNRVYIGKIEIPVGNSYKEDFLREIGMEGNV
ncbi:MAG: DNA-binding response regulator [Sphingobacteriales bacterium 46-32]|mgnify:CR=1 FL=1|nr:MAG: DNA-binding response regulator [Sphingobacteriales bacterium 46-32]